MQINPLNFSKTNPIATMQAAKSGSGSDENSNVKTGKSSLDMQDFLKLLAAQMQNQDVMNPMDNTEFISQMAQFTSLQAIQTLTQITTALSDITYAQYGASLVGKKVVVAGLDESGKLVEDTGVVSSVNFSNYSLVVNGKTYDLSSVMQVVSDTTPTPPDDNNGDAGETA